MKTNEMSAEKYKEQQKTTRDVMWAMATIAVILILALAYPVTYETEISVSSALLQTKEMQLVLNEPTLIHIKGQTNALALNTMLSGLRP